LVRAIALFSRYHDEYNEKYGGYHFFSWINQCAEKKTCSLAEEKIRGTVFINSYSDHNEKGNYVFFFILFAISWQSS
jgi:hypothetical protein